MAVFLQPIYTQTVGAGGAASITFNNIPQTFTDIQVVMSLRGSAAAQNVDINGYANSITTGGLYSVTAVGGNGSSPYSFNAANINYLYFGSIPAASNTANTFGSVNLYFPNYTGSNFKQIISDEVGESNSATNLNLQMHSVLLRSSAAISALTLYPGTGNWAQYSTISIYGILRSGV